MNKLKRLGSLLLAIIFAFSMTCTAFATSGDTGTITITNATIGETYHVYKLFDATYGTSYVDASTNETVIPTNYVATAAQYAALKDVSGNVFDFTALNDGTYQVTVKDGVTDDLVVAFVKSYIVELSGTVTACNFPGAVEVTGDSTSEGIDENKVATASTVKINGLALGYYFVTSSLGSVISLDTTNPAAEIVDKNTADPGWDNDEPEPDTPVKHVLNTDDRDIDGEKVTVGSTLTYTISYTNTSGVTLDSVVVTDAPPTATTYASGSIAIEILDDTGTATSAITTDTDDTDTSALTWTISSLPDGYTLVAEFQVTVNNDAVSVLAGSPIENTANMVVNVGENVYNLKTNQVENPVGEETDPVKDVVDDSGDSINGDTVKVGDILTYTIDYEAVEAGTLTIIDAAPTGTVYVAGSAAGTVNNSDIAADSITINDAGTITWACGTVSAGDVVSVSFQVEVTEAALTIISGKIENTATVEVGTNTYTTNVVKNPVEEEDKNEPVKDVVDDSGASINGDKVEVDDVLTYTITYTNTDDDAVDVTITDAAPEGTDYVDTSAAVDTVGTCTSSDASVDNTTGTITWTITGLASGESVTVSFQVTVNSGALTLTDKTVVNTATVTVGEHTYETNEVKNPVTEDKDIDPEKDVVDNSGDSINRENVKVGDILTYAIEYTVPSGGGDLTVTDTVPAGTTYVSGSAAGTVNGVAIDGSCIVVDSGTVTWTLTGLSANDEVVVTFQVGVTEDALTTGEVENTATVEIGGNEYTTNIVKNPVPDEPKEEDFGKVIVNADGSNTSASTGFIGDTVTFDVSIDAVNNVSDENGDGKPDQVAKYYIYDQMEAGFTLDKDSFALTIGSVTCTVEDPQTASSGAVTYTIKNGADEVGTLYYYEDGTTGCTLIGAIIYWVDSNEAALYPNCEIHLTYDATLDEDAVIAGDGNVNSAIYDYSIVKPTTTPVEPNPEDPVYPTGSDLNHWNYEISTRTYTYALGVLKVSSTTGEALEGAEFTVTDPYGNTVYAETEGDGVYRYTSDPDSQTKTNTFVSNADGQIVIKGVDIGTYTFTETKAPDGYVLLENSVAVTAAMDSSTTTNNVTTASVTRTFAAVTETEWDDVTEVYVKDANDGTFALATKPSAYATGYYKLVASDYTAAAVETETVTTTFEVAVAFLSIENVPGIALPGTGGIGTTIFYIVGGVLVLGAVVLFITKKRMGE